MKRKCLCVVLYAITSHFQNLPLKPSKDKVLDLCLECLVFLHVKPELPAYPTADASIELGVADDSLEPNKLVIKKEPAEYRRDPHEDRECNDFVFFVFFIPVLVDVK